MRQSFEDKCEMRGGMHFKMVDPRMCCNWLSIEEKFIMQSLEGIYFKKNFVAVPCGLYNLSSPTKDRTQAHSCKGTAGLPGVQ